jgi:hypothetical protein
MGACLIVNIHEISTQLLYFLNKLLGLYNHPCEFQECASAPLQV